jgi:pimeloyl-ACP methyl ester carboxylesterase
VVEASFRLLVFIQNKKGIDVRVCKYFKQLMVALVFGALLISISSASTFDEVYVELPSRKKITQSFLLIDPPNPIASVILFAGGAGYLKLQPDGSVSSGNFLVRSRALFAAHGLRVAVFEVPSNKRDDNGLFGGYRRSKKHAQDIEVVVDYLQAKGTQPVWLVGTSRGSPSAANGAARLADKNKIKGVVLTSSLSMDNINGTNIFEIDLKLINVPAYVASHKDDRCHVTPPFHVEAIARKLKNSPKVETALFEGGDEPRGRACGAKSEHGFIGIEQEVVTAIVGFIKASS